MSKVYSFRLDENNPREAQAREVIDAWVSRGYSVRYVIVEALNRFESDNHLNSIAQILEKFDAFLNNFEQGQVSQNINKLDDFELSLGFLESIRKTAKPGEKAD